MDVEKATFVRVYMDHFSHDEWRRFGLTRDEMNSLEGIVNNDQALESARKKLMKAARDFWIRTDKLIEPICSWKFDPRAFLPIGPYVCAIPEKSEIDDKRQEEIKKYLMSVCPWTANVQTCLVSYTLEPPPVVSGSAISFELPSGKHFRFKREDVLVIGDGPPRVGI